MIIVLADQVTKLLVEKHFQVGQVKEIVPGLFNLILTYNPGIAFGMLAKLDPGVRMLAMGGTTIVALIVIIYLLVKEYRNDSVGQVALIMVLAGAAGNIIDRVRIGMVIDFLDFYYQKYHWPAFNVADSTICIAVLLLLFRQARPIKEGVSGHFRL